MKKIKHLVFIFLFLALNTCLYAQFEDFEKEDTNKKEKKWQLSDRIIYGGDFGLQFGTVTSINVSPQIGYRVTNWYNVGITGTYIYYNNKIYEYATSIYGGGVFTQLIPFKFLVLHAEVDMLNLDSYENYPEVTRTWDMPVLVGAGYRMPIGEKGSVNYMFLWNINETKNSPFTNPIIRINFMF